MPLRAGLIGVIASDPRGADTSRGLGVEVFDAVGPSDAGPDSSAHVVQGEAALRGAQAGNAWKTRVAVSVRNAASDAEQSNRVEVLADGRAGVDVVITSNARRNMEQERGRDRPVDS